MHESALAQQLVRVVLDRAQVANACRVLLVRGWVAETESLSRESLRFHFAAHARGTAAEGAELELRLIHVQAECLACGSVYAPEHHLLVCPSCGSLNGRELGPTGLGIDSLEVDASA